MHRDWKGYVENLAREGAEFVFVWGNFTSQTHCQVSAAVKTTVKGEHTTTASVSIVMICDEIQSGFARTGRMFATEYAGIEPDLMTMAKGIAGGVPLSAVVGKQHIMDASPAGGLGGTYGGSPLATAAALAVLEVIKEEKLIERANFIESQFRETLGKLEAKFPQIIGDIRGKGAMMALELVSDGDADKPNTDLTKAIIGEAMNHGLVLLACGFYGNVIRFLPPLTIDDATLSEGLSTFVSLFHKVAS